MSNRLLSRENRISYTAILLVLVMLTGIFLVNTTLARYVAEVSATDSAMVAAPIVYFTSREDALTFDKDLGGEYRFTVSNVNADGKITETAMRYVVRLTVPQDSTLAPDALYLCTGADYSGKTLLLDTFSSREGNVFIYADETMRVSAGVAESRYYSLSLTAETAEELTMNVEIFAEQID